MAANIPAHATRVNFTSSNGVKGVYFIWESHSPRGWCWVALGNSGTAKTERDASLAARTWIRDHEVPDIPRD